MNTEQLTLRSKNLIEAFREASGNSQALTMEEYLSVRKAVISEEQSGVHSVGPTVDMTVTEKRQSVTIPERPAPAVRAERTSAIESPPVSVPDEPSAPMTASANGFDLLQSLEDPWN